MNATAEHRATWELLPWYVNGTLDAAERDRVERHLELCPECRSEVELCHALVEAGGRPEDLAPTPHPARLDRLVAQIVARDEAAEGEPDADRTGSPESPAGARRFGWRTSTGFGGGLRVAAAALLLVAAGAVGYLLAPGPGLGSVSESTPEPTPEPAQPAEYRTLSQPEAPLPAPSDAGGRVTVLRMVFSPSTPEQDIRRILLAVGGAIVDGPSPLGVYTVRLGTGADGARPEPVAVVLDHLRREAGVLFVEPVDGGGGAEPTP